jgi:hypothetical protein
LTLQKISVVKVDGCWVPAFAGMQLQCDLHRTGKVERPKIERFSA